jgi:pimeloyl-ACP methyl ester carboxylesterase
MEELVHTWTEDGLLLDGVRYGAASADLAVVYTHGITGSVFRPTHVLVGRALERAGYAVVAGNNRGTGVATSFLRRSGQRFLGGSWFERLEGAISDIASWMDVAAAGGARRIVLLGHSLGAAKVVMYASERRDPRLVGLVLASPAFRLASGQRRIADEILTRARRALDEGRPEELIELGDQGLTYGRMSAATLIDYVSGRASPWSETAPRLGAIDCPVLAFYGTAEPDIGGQAELDRIATLVPGSFTASLLPDADHLYVGREAAAAALVAAWIGSVVPERPLAREAPT